MAIVRLPVAKKGQNIVSVTTILAKETFFQEVNISLGCFMINLLCYEWSKKSANVVLAMLEIRVNLLS